MANLYPLLKAVHGVTAVGSVFFLLLLGYWGLRDPERLRPRWTQLLPLGNNGLLLFTAVALMVLTGMYPPAQVWLTAKVAAMVVYVVLARVALARTTPAPLRAATWLSSLAVVFYILWVAKVRQPLPWLS